MTADFVAFDFETATGDRDSACSLGVAVVRDGELAEVRSWLICPPQPDFSPFNVRIHGITEDDVAGEPDFGELWSEVAPYLSADVLVAHNAPFDLGVLRALMARYRLRAPRGVAICTCSLARRTMPDLPNHRLPTVADAFGIELEHHDAASDALACAGIARLCSALAGVRGPREAAEVLGVRVEAVARG